VDIFHKCQLEEVLVQDSKNMEMKKWRKEMEVLDSTILIHKHSHKFKL
jgi:hypothetical protein